MLCYTVSEVARLAGCRPRLISDLFYERRLSDAACPVIGGKRLIPPGYVPAILAALRERGHAPAEPTPSDAEGAS